jgi:hypothetical protein
MNELYDLVRLDKPRPPPSVHAGASGDSEVVLGGADGRRDHLGFKEIVLGIDTNELFHDSLKVMRTVDSDTSVPSIYQLQDGNPALRLLPSPFSAMIFHVDDIDAAQAALEADHLYGGRVGHTGNSVGQVCNGV